MDSFFDEVDDELLQIFSLVSSPRTPVPFVQPPLSPPKKTSDLTLNAVDNRRGKPPATKNANENENRKIIHRDVERQRRQEMANLYSSLRSLLPQEYLKGKRSVSDHMNEAVNSIKHMQTKMRELNDKRDALRRLLKFSTINTVGQSSTHRQDVVMARPSSTGAHIVVDTAIADNCLPLSTVIRVLEADGIHIISCISTVVKNRAVYTVDCEVNGKDRDLSELQKRLTILVLLYLN